MPRPAILLTVLLLAGCGGSEARVASTATDPNQPPEVRVEGLDGGETVELRAAWKSDVDGARWTSALRLRANEDGVAVAGPEILTAMQPPEGAETYFFPSLGRNEIALSAHADGETIARGTLVRDFPAPASELTVAQDGLAALCFEPENPSGVPVVLIGGSEGGYGGLASEASALAAAGHRTLALAYFAELEPSLADDLIALVPSSRIGFAFAGRKPAWTRKGRPLEPRGRIPVERIRGDILAVGAGADSLTRSKYFVQEIEERAEVDALQYEKAGFLVGQPLPYLPGKPTNITGGTPEADEAARQDLWPKILAALSD